MKFNEYTSVVFLAHVSPDIFF